MLDNYESIQMRFHPSGVGLAPDENLATRNTTTSSTTTSTTTTNTSSAATLPSSSNTTRTTTRTTTTTSERTRFRMEWQLSRALVGSTLCVLHLCRVLWVGTTEILAASHLSTSVIHRISILLIVIDFLVRLLQDYLKDALKESPEKPLSLEVQVIWLAPLFTTIASYSFFLSLVVLLRPTSHAVILTGVVSLALVECLVPVTLTGCTALFWFNVFSAETALLILFVVWVAASVSSQCIRCVLYPNLGHG